MLVKSLRGGRLPAGRAQRPLARGAAGSAQSAPARCGSSTARWDKAPPVRTRPHPLARSGANAAWFCVGLSAATRSRMLRKVRADFRRIRYACRPAPHHARAREARRGRRTAREMLARRRSNASCLRARARVGQAGAKPDGPAAGEHLAAVLLEVEVVRRLAAAHRHDLEVKGYSEEDPPIRNTGGTRRVRLVREEGRGVSS
jgi:hypothetical protein